MGDKDVNGLMSAKTKAIGKGEKSSFIPKALMENGKNAQNSQKIRYH